MDYHEQVAEDAKDFIEEHLANFKESGKDSFYQWMSYDGKLHEWVDSSYNSYDDEEICDSTDNLETDTGLWEGITDWRRIRSIQAFYTLKTDIWWAIVKRLKDEELLPEEQIQ